MRYVYIVGTNSHRSGLSCLDMAKVMLKSLDEHYPGVALKCFWEDLDEETKNTIRYSHAAPVHFGVIPLRDLELPFDVWKYKYLLQSEFQDGDEIIMLDLDGIVTGDVFDAFRYNFDLAFTQRRPWNSLFPINTGFVAMRWSDRTRKFVELWNREIENPTAESYKELLDMVEREGIHECRGQDYICCLLAMAAFTNIDIAVLPSEFNWFPGEAFLEGSLETQAEFEKGLKDPKNYFIHFKGNNKKIMRELCNV